MTSEAAVGQDVDQRGTDLLTADLEPLLASRYIEQFNGPAQVGYVKSFGAFYSYQRQTVGPFPSIEDAMNEFTRVFMPVADTHAGSKGNPRFIIWRHRPKVVKMQNGFGAGAAYVFVHTRTIVNSALEMASGEAPKVEEVKADA